MGRFWRILLSLFILSGCAKQPGFKADDYDYRRVAPEKSLIYKDDKAQKSPIQRTSNKIVFKPTDSKWENDNLQLKADVQFGPQSFGEVEFRGTKVDDKVLLEPIDPKLSENLKAQLICVSEGDSCDEFFIDVFYKDGEKIYHDQIIPTLKPEKRAELQGTPEPFESEGDVSPGDVPGDVDGNGREAENDSDSSSGDQGFGNQFRDEGAAAPAPVAPAAPAPPVKMPAPLIPIQAPKQMPKPAPSQAPKATPAPVIPIKPPTWAQKPAAPAPAPAKPVVPAKPTPAPAPVPVPAPKKPVPAPVVPASPPKPTPAPAPPMKKPAPMIPIAPPKATPAPAPVQKPQPKPVPAPPPKPVTPIAPPAATPAPAPKPTPPAPVQPPVVKPPVSVTTTTTTTTTTTSSTAVKPKKIIKDGAEGAEKKQISYVGTSDEDVYKMFKMKPPVTPSEEPKVQTQTPPVAAPEKEPTPGKVPSFGGTAQQTSPEKDLFFKYQAKNQIEGSPVAGRLTNATNFDELSQLPGIHFFIINPNPRSPDYFGSFDLAVVMRKLGDILQTLMPGKKLGITSISNYRGGKIPPHTGHQNGTDADVRYLTEDDGRGDFVDRYGNVSRDLKIDKQWKLLKAAVETDMIEAIFVDKNIRRELCREARRSQDLRSGDSSSPGAKVLQKIQSWPGHDDHFHVRAKCTQNNKKCAPMPISAQPPGC